MSARTMPGLTLTAPTSFPTAGAGGYYYDTQFTVPTYASDVANKVTWRTLDNWDRININYASTQGIAAGLVWATLIYLLALTPSRKRTTPFHSFLLVGSVFMLVHLMIDIISSLTPGLHALSAYTFLTGDFSSSVWPVNYAATFAASQVSGWIAFIFAALCLWLQAKGLMTGIRVRFPAAYKVIHTYLVLTAFAALATAMGFSIQQVQQIGLQLTEAEVKYAYRLRVAYLAAYAICIGSFSLVSIFSVVDIIWKRPSSVIKGHNAYTSALNLVGLLCAQSFVIPFIFCILQLVPGRIGMMQPEVMLLPSVYLILPLGSLFMTVNGNEVESQKISFPPKCGPSPMGHCGESSPTLTNGTTPSSRPTSFTLDGDNHKSLCSQVPRELNMVDTLDNTITEGKETDSMLKNKVDKGTKTVSSEMV